MRGGLLLDLGRADEAMGVYEKLLSGQLDPGLSSWPGRASATPYERKGKLEEARAVFAKLGADGNWPSTRTGPVYHEARPRRAARQPGRRPRGSITRCWKRTRPPRCGRDLESTRGARAEVSRAPFPPPAPSPSRGRGRGAGRLARRRLRLRHRPPPGRTGGLRPPARDLCRSPGARRCTITALFEPSPEECASAVLAQAAWSSARARPVVGVAPETGHLDWATPVSGGVDSAARFDSARGQVYLGADDGSFYAVDPGDRHHPLDLPGQGRDRTPGGGRGRPGLRRQRRGSRGRARGGHRKVALAVRARHARRLHHPRLRRPAPRRRRRSWPASPTATSSRWPPRRVTYSGRAPSPPPRISSSTSTRRRPWSATSRSCPPTRAASTRVDPRDGTVRWRLGIEGVGDVTAAAGPPLFRAPRQGLHAASWTVASSGGRASPRRAT